MVYKRFYGKGNSKSAENTVCIARTSDGTADESPDTAAEYGKTCIPRSAQPFMPVRVMPWIK